MKKNLIVLALGMAVVMPAKAQWTNWDTQTAINGVLGIANKSIESAERKKQMEIRAQEKVQYEQSFKDAMEEAKAFEESEKWEDALSKYEEAAKLQYRYVRENPVYVNKKNASNIKIVRVACSDKETRIEMEIETTSTNYGVNFKGTTYIKGNKGGKLTMSSVENIVLHPAYTRIPWPYQKLRFALIFPPLPEEAKEFDLIEPSSTWQFKDIKCK